jgi:surface antigen
MGNRSTLTAPPSRTSTLRDYRTLTLPALPRPTGESSSGAPYRDDERARSYNDELYERQSAPAAAPKRTLATATGKHPAYVEHRLTGAPRARPGADERARDAHQGYATGARLQRTGQYPALPVTASRAFYDEPDSISPAVGRLPMVIKRPPMWVIANLAILLVVGLGIALPQLLPVDAASACQWYSVRPGDTLGNLGWAHHTNALALARANHLRDPNLIYVGQKLCIPMSAWAESHSAPAVPAMPSRHGDIVGAAVTGKQASFVTQALPYAQLAHADCHWPVSLILAHWGVEQGWHVPGYTGFNWGNSSAISGFPTVAGLNVPGSPAAFAYAKTPEQGLRIYETFCHMGYYRSVAPAAASGGVDAAAVALGRSPWDAGHYTSTNTPGSTLLMVLRVYNLYWFDRPREAAQSAAPAQSAQSGTPTVPAKVTQPAPPQQQPPAAPTHATWQGVVGLAPEPCDPHIPSAVWTSVDYHQQWALPPGCYGGVYVPNSANYAYRRGFGWCNWWPEVLRPDESQLPWGNGLVRSATPRIGATVFFVPFNQGAGPAGHFAHVESISPDGQYILVSEMNDSWRGAGFGKVNYRYVRVEPGVSFIY